MLAFFNPLLTVLILLLQHLQESRELGAPKEERILRPLLSTSTLTFKKDEDLNLLPQFPPNHEPNHIEESRLKRLEDLVEALQATIDQLSKRDLLSEPISRPHRTFDNA
ncbi:hypothetical protein DL93DRAFT_2087779 [Clavulina sp. PMI_390]|nr:hypothetical protein DL93DRAFT_2087779 [Clavulina sp. PMI_390]